MAEVPGGRAGSDAPAPARSQARSSGAPEPSQARPESLTRAAGVRALGPERPRARQANPGRARLLAVVACVCALAICAGAFFGCRAVLDAANGTRAQAGSATSATDAYVGVAVTSADGALERAGVLYADTINNRALLAWVAPDARDAASGGASTETFAEAYARGGADGLESALEQSAGVSLAGVLSLTDDELAQVLSLASGESGAPSPSALAASLAGGESLSADALRGLFATLRDVGDAGFVELSAPTQSQTGDEGGASVLRSSECQARVRAMRDPTA